jgi:hypothetical protein
VESDELALEGPDYVEVWVSEGDWEQAARFTHVEVEPPTAALTPVPLIHAAFNSAAPTLHFQLLPSSRGVALLRFGNAAARESAMAAQPFRLQGATVTVKRVEESEDHFFRPPQWLAEVMVLNFPEEHWTQAKVREIYSCVGSVVEIDPL